nr:zinc finger, CCHC-type [Tanacetum cinerariifolium]
MAKQDAFLVDDVEGGLCVDYTDAEIVERCYSGSNKDKGKWENDDYICRGRVLNGMSDSLFDVYTNVESAKELWDSLEFKYMAEDSSSKKSLGKEVVGPSVNMTEEGKNKHNKQNKGKKRGSNDNNDGSSSNKKPKLECWKCGKTCHFKKDCRSGNKKNANAGGLGKGSKDQSKDQGHNLILVLQLMFVKTVAGLRHTNRWKTDLYMGDDHYAPVHGKGSVALEFSSGKTITLFNVLYVPKLRKNLVSGPVLNMCRYKQVYESDKYILSKSGVFVGFDYYNNGMFMLNLNKVPDDSSFIYMSSSTVVNTSLWRARLGHMHYKRMLEMSKDDLIPTVDEITKNTLLESFMKLQLLTHHGVPKRKNRALKEMVNSMLSYSESRDAIFDENRFFSIPRPKDIIPNSDESLRDDHSDDVPNEISKPRKEAIDDEIGSIMENNTWVLSDLPPGCKPLGCKWIFKRKTKVNGIIDKFKARLVIQDKCVYSKFDSSGGVIICLYVDDMLIFGTDQNQVNKTKKFLSLMFSMKDMGEANVILGIKIKRENIGIVITQSHYIEKILKKFNREDCSPVSTPMDPIEKLKPNTGKLVDQLEYSRAIGCLMYAMTSIRPDIAYAVGRLSRFTSNPSRQHWHAITRVFKYLKGTVNYGLSYVGYPLVLEAYSDASWINHVEDSSSTSGWVFLFGGCAISLAFKKQTCITGSTKDSEFVALAGGGARTKRTTYVNIKFCRFKKLGLGFLKSRGQGGRAPLQGQGAEPFAGVSLPGQRAGVEGAAPQNLNGFL